MSVIIKTGVSKLKSTLSPTDINILVDKFVDHKGNKLTLNDFNNQPFNVVIKQGNNTEIIKISGIIQNPDGTALLQVATDGRNLDGKPPYTGSTTGIAFNPGAELFTTNDPDTLSNFVSKDIDNVIKANVAFEKFPRKSGINIPTNASDFATKEYVDTIASGGSLSVDSQTTIGIAGEDLLAGDIIYFANDSKWYKAKAGSASVAHDSKLGIAQQNTTAGGQLNVVVSGVASLYNSLTQGSKYYLSNTTHGQITTTKTDIYLGVALDQTNLLFEGVSNVSKVSVNEKEGLNTTKPLSNINHVLTRYDRTSASAVSGADISFTATGNKITKPSGGFETFLVGEEIEVVGSSSNDGTYIVQSVSSTEITVDGIITDEAAGANVEVKSILPNKLAMYDQNGKLKVDIPGFVTLTAGQNITAGTVVAFNDKYDFLHQPANYFSSNASMQAYVAGNNVYLNAGDIVKKLIVFNPKAWPGLTINTTQAFIYNTAGQINPPTSIVTQTSNNQTFQNDVYRIFIFNYTIQTSGWYMFGLNTNSLNTKMYSSSTSYRIYHDINSIPTSNFVNGILPMIVVIERNGDNNVYDFTTKRSADVVGVAIQNCTAGGDCIIALPGAVFDGGIGNINKDNTMLRQVGINKFTLRSSIDYGLVSQNANATGNLNSLSRYVRVFYIYRQISDVTVYEHTFSTPGFVAIPEVDAHSRAQYLRMNIYKNNSNSVLDPRNANIFIDNDFIVHESYVYQGFNYSIPYVKGRIIL